MQNASFLLKLPICYTFSQFSDLSLIPSGIRWTSLYTPWTDPKWVDRIVNRGFLGGKLNNGEWDYPKLTTGNWINLPANSSDINHMLKHWFPRYSPWTMYIHHILAAIGNPVPILFPNLSIYQLYINHQPSSNHILTIYSPSIHHVLTICSPSINNLSTIYHPEVNVYTTMWEHAVVFRKIDVFRSLDWVLRPQWTSVETSNKQQK